VPDREIAPLARRLAAAGAAAPGRTFLHHAGALGVDVLEPSGQAGASVGVLHPLQSLGVAGLAREVLPGSAARIEGSGQGLLVARRLARDLQLVPVHLGPDAGPDERIAYHAAAAMASNDVVALLGTALDLLGLAGIDRARGLSMLGPLARGTLLQAERGGLGAAITGPASRGDAETVRKHLLALAGISDDAADVHRLLSRQLLDLARREGRDIPPADRRRVLRLLGPRGGRGRDPAV